MGCIGVGGAGIGRILGYPGERLGYTRGSGYRQRFWGIGRGWLVLGHRGGYPKSNTHGILHKGEIGFEFEPVPKVTSSLFLVLPEEYVP